MTTIRATCPTCGDVRLKASDVVVRVCANDNQGSYCFRCPSCGVRVTKSADSRIVDLLASSGVRMDVWHLPAELWEAKPSGAPVSYDDLLDFHLMLQDAMGMILGWILTVERMPQLTAELVLRFAEHKALVLLAVNLLVLFLGCFIEGAVLLLVLPPILVPPLVRIGVDPVHFGVVMIVGVGIGLFTPPVGVALYAMQGFAKTSFAEVVAAVSPWLLPLIGALFVITYVPWIALALPRALGY